MGTTVNQRIAIARKNAGYNQKTAAEILEIKYSTYSQMERRGQNISPDRLKKMAELYKVSLDYLVYGIEDTPNVNPPETKPIHIPEPEPPRLGQEPMPPIPVPTESTFVLKPRERNLIRIIRSLKESKREELIKYIEDNYYHK